nr:sterol carrier family protein [Actinomadura flavalba]
MPRTPFSRTALDEQRSKLGLPPYDGPDEPAPLRRAALDTVLAARARCTAPDRPVLTGAVRYLLDRLAERAPGRSVEVRIPPHAAVQCVDGPHHTRGTPPNVVEMDAATWIALATGQVSWDNASTAGMITASGQRADLSPYLPIPLD